MTAKNRLTAADAKAFHGYIKKWQGLLNLHDWRVERSAKTSKAMAEISMSLGDRLAVYRLGADFGDSTPVTPHSLESTACHELLHVLLHELVNASDDSLESIEHRVINTLEKLLVPETR